MIKGWLIGLLLVVVLAVCLRFYQLDIVPNGLHADEESHGYNAYSLFETGKDRYGQSFPILFRSFGSYQPPLYTYLAILPVNYFGNSVFAIRSISAAAGVLLTIVTYFVVIKVVKKNVKKQLGLISCLLIAISPWSIYFSRLTAEGSLGVTVFVLSLLFLLISLKQPKYFLLGCMFLGLSTHAYYSERIISIFLLPIFVFLNKKYFFDTNRKWLILGLSIFSFLMIPHIIIAPTGALTRRLDQVGYLRGGIFLPLEFVRRYITYFSPGNLFFATGDGVARISPEMGVLYGVLIIPFLVGIFKIRNYLLPKYWRLAILLILILPLPAALTGDSYYPLRALDLLWAITFIIAAGIYWLTRTLTENIRVVFIVAGTTLLLFSFYCSYFVLFKYEGAKYYSYVYMQLPKFLEKFSNNKVIIDSTRDNGIGLRIAYFSRFNPHELQSQLKQQMKSSYYSSDVNVNEYYEIGNIEVRPFTFGDVCSPKTIIVGDKLLMTQAQVVEFNLRLEFEINDPGNEQVLYGYSTHPTSKKCKPNDKI